MRCIVTGGAGFIGSNLALALEKHGSKVIVVDDFSTGSRDNLQGFQGEIIEHDVSFPMMSKQPVDVVFHSAGITDPRFPDDSRVLENNIRGFSSMLALARIKNARLIYASTASMYGNTACPQAENQPKELLSAYAESKLIIDEMASHDFGTHQIIGLRYFNVYGRGEAFKGRAASMIFQLFRQMLLGQRPRIFGDGEQSRDHVYVKDCIAANFCALTAPSGIYNVGTGVATTFNQIVGILNRLLGTNLEPDYIDNPYASTYQVRTEADTTRAQRLLTFKSSWSLSAGVRNYLNSDSEVLTRRRIPLDA